MVTMRQPSSSHSQHEATYVCDMQTLNPTTVERGSSYRGKRIQLQGQEDPATGERGSSYRGKRIQLQGQEDPATGERGSSYRGKRIQLQGKKDPTTVERGSSYRDKRFLHTSLADLRLVSEVGTLTLEPKAM